MPKQQWNSVITDEDYDEIKMLFYQGVSIKDIANIVGVRYHTALYHVNKMLQFTTKQVKI